MSRVVLCTVMVLSLFTAAVTAPPAAADPSPAADAVGGFGIPFGSDAKGRPALPNGSSGTFSAGTEGADKEKNPLLFENYQHCYSSLIADVVALPPEEVEIRKRTVKKYCRAMVTVRNQKKFSDCFNSRLSGSTDLDRLVRECMGENQKPSQ